MGQRPAHGAGSAAGDAEGTGALGFKNAEVTKLGACLPIAVTGVYPEVSEVGLPQKEGPPKWRLKQH